MGQASTSFATESGEGVASPRFDRSDPAFHANPYPFYRRMRQQAPVHRVHQPGCEPNWYVFGYRDVAELLRDPRLRTSKPVEGLGANASEAMQPVLSLFGNMMLTWDPPEHARLRNLVNKAFTPRVVEQLRPRGQAVMNELLDAALERGKLDIVRDVAVPLPVIVIAELLGVPAEDRVQLKRWSDDIAPMVDGSLRQAALGRIVASGLALRDYLAGILEQRRAAPHDDLLSALLAAQDADARLSDDEVLATSVLILAAGHETTSNLIGNGMRALLEHPEQCRQLRAEPERVPVAVEEMLRFDPPVQFTSRVATCDIEIGGQRIPAGHEIDLLIGSANRDPEIFPDPDRFEIGRSDNRHLSFGHGIHFCLGAALARLEACVAVETLLRRLPALALADRELVQRPGFVLRGLESLPVRS